VGGFTIVELLAGMVAASVLAIAVGSVLFYAYRGWTVSSESVDMQRDGTIAMLTLSKRIRAAVPSGVSVSGSDLSIARGGTTAVFRVTGADLLFDPNAAVSGDEVVLVDGRLSAFLPTPFSEGVRIQMQLTTGDENMAFDSVIGFRNE